VPHSETVGYYQNADVFLFPTLSDGFGLTQLEAQAWQLPVIASRTCGEVVTDRINGLLLPEVSGEAVAAALDECLRRPALLAAMAEGANRTVARFTLKALRRDLHALERDRCFGDAAEPAAGTGSQAGLG